MIKYCAIFSVSALLAYLLLALLEVSFNIALWPRDTRATLCIAIAAAAFILAGMYNDK